MINQMVHAFPQSGANFNSILTANGAGFYEVAPSSSGPTPTPYYYCINFPEAGQPTTYAFQIAATLGDATGLYVRQIVNGSVGPWFKVWHAGNMGAGSGLNADTVQGFVPLRKDTDTINPGPLTIIRSIAAAANLYQNAQLSIQTPNAAANGNEVAAIGFLRNGVTGMALYHDANLWLRMVNQSGVVSELLHTQKMGAGSGINADTVRAFVPSTTLAANGIPVADAAGHIAPTWINASIGPGFSGGIPIADASGKLDASWLPASGLVGVPAGLIALWLNTTLPAGGGWVLLNTMAGKFPVGSSGTTGAYQLGQSGGGAATHIHTITHSHKIDHGHVGNETTVFHGSQVRVQVSGTGTDPQATQSDHTHTSSVQGITNTDSGTMSTGVSLTPSAVDLPPWLAFSYIQKT